MIKMEIVMEVMTKCSENNRSFEFQLKYTRTLQSMFRNPFYENNSEKSLHTKMLVTELYIKYEIIN